MRSAPAPQIPPLSAAGAEPALCVHGLEGSSRNWTDLIDLLRARLACQAVDLPGFGDSPPRPDGRYSIAALAQTVIALIEKQERGPVHLIGNSLGGAVCVKVAATRPELIRTLTLISPALPDSRPRLDLLRFPVMSLPGVGRPADPAVPVLPPERRVADVIATCYSDPALFSPARFATEVAELARRDSLGYAAAVLAGSVRTLTAEFLRKGGRSAWRDAARITAPSLVIYGSRDRLVDPRNGGPGRARISRTRGSWCCRAPATSRTWSVLAWWRPKSVSCWPPAGRPAGAGAGIPARFRRLTVARAEQGNTRSVRQKILKAHLHGEHSVVAAAGRARRRADGR